MDADSLPNDVNRRRLLFGGAALMTALVRVDAQDDLRAAADRVRTKVVVLKATRMGRAVSGAGFLAAPGLVLTAGHVVREVSSLAAWVNGVAYRARLAAHHPDCDVAAVHLESPALLLKPAELAPTSEGLRPGESLLVLAGPAQGSRANGDPAQRALIPTAFRKRVVLMGSAGKPGPVLAMRGSVRPGDSGSPVLRVSDGVVVGLLTSRERPDDSGVSEIAYAIPIERLRAWFEMLPRPRPDEDEDFYLSPGRRK